MSLLCLVLILGFTLNLRFNSGRAKRPCTYALALYLQGTCEILVFFCIGWISAASSPEFTF